MLNINVTWWNTGLDAPVVHTKPKTISVTEVHHMIRKLCNLSNIVILGEYVNRHSLLNDIPVNFRLKDYFMKHGKCLFHNIILYDETVVKFIPIENFSLFELHSNNESKYRVCQIARFEMLDTNDIIDIYIIHWRQNSDGDNRKDAAARVIVNDLDTRSEEANHRIIIGDFNTEPYTDPLRTLGASRCLRYAKKYGTFWNPFWEYLKSNNPGTICCGNKNQHQCFHPVFDQILISKSILDEPHNIITRIITDFHPQKNEHWPIMLDIKGVKQ